MAERPRVWKGPFTGKWWAFINTGPRSFPSFAEAITYADHHARTTKNGDNK